jgi:hypothetical protein
MIKRLLTTVAFLFPVFLIGQGLNYKIGSNINYDQQVGAIAVVDEFTYVAENITNYDPFVSSSYLSKIDTLGNIIWKKKVLATSTDFRVKVKSIFISSQGNVLVTGFRTEDCNNDSVYTFVEEFDNNGLSLSSRLHYGWNKAGAFFNTCLFETDLGNVFSVINAGQFSEVFFNDENNNLDSLYFSQTEIKSLNQINDSVLIAITNDSLFSFDFEGTVLNTKNFSDDVQCLDKINSDSILILTTDSLFVLNSSFQHLFSDAFGGYNNYGNLKVIDGRVLFTGAIGQDRFLIELDNNLQIESTISLDYFGMLDYSLSHLSAASSQLYYTIYKVKISDYSLNRVSDVIANEVDVELLNVRVNEVKITKSDTNESYYRLNFNVDVLLRNHSSIVLDSCRVNAELGSSICELKYFSEMKTGLNLSPNGSGWVALGWIGETFDSGYINQINYNKCFYTSNPNGILDVNFSNDSYCASGIAGYVSLEEKEAVLIDVYPNPAKDFITIESKNKIDEITIYDLGGRVVKKLLNQNVVSVSELEKGVYNVEIRTEVTRTVKKIIVN